MNSIVKLLNSYNGRDKLVRTVCYIFMYLSSRTRGSASQKFKLVSQELSHCRLILRLFDDFPMLKHTFSYGFGKKEEDYLFRFLSVLNNIVDQLYYPVEHMAWAAETRLISASSSLWSTVGTALWGVSSYISILRSLITMSELQKKTIGLKDLERHENIVKEQLEHLITAVKNAADAAIAINYLPVGSLLWAGKLNTNQIGCLGILSSVLSLVLILRRMEKV